MKQVKKKKHTHPKRLSFEEPSCDDFITGNGGIKITPKKVKASKEKEETIRLFKKPKGYWKRTKQQKHESTKNLGFEFTIDHTPVGKPAKHPL